MSNHRQIKLPVYRNAPAPPPVPPPFQPGSKVYLQSCQVGIPGVVTGHSRGRVHVSWPGWNLTGKYRPDRLMLAAAASDQDGSADGPQSPQDAPQAPG